LPGLAVDQVAEFLDRLERRPVAVATGLCARQRHRRSTCRRCFDACPAGAIAWDEGLEIDWEACTGCGICAAVCPTAALEASEPSDDELLVQIQEFVEKRRWVAFACPRALESAAGSAACLSVSCLGRLDEGLLVSAVACGAEQVGLVDGACEGCFQAGGRAVAGTMVARANALLEALGLPARVAFRGDLPAVAPVGRGGAGSAEGVSRRGLFKVLARETARMGGVAAETAQIQEGKQEAAARGRGDLPRALPSSRLLLLAALKRLDVPAGAALVCEGGPFGQFQLGEGCTGCQMCAFFCPTGALTRVVDGKRVGLAFRVSHCVHCGLCRDTCYRDAVSLSSVVDLNKVLALAVDWCFAQEMDAEPWKKGLGEGVARQILGELSRSR
jgi:Pyruvate/2-oxoacid:ferredoxin oxidoreductase delta subunit